MTLTIGVDPRIRARRIAVRRAEGRRRLRFLLVAMALVAAAVGGWAVSRSALLDLDHVRIGGVSPARAHAVEAAVALERGTPLVDLDLGAVESAAEAIPWVRAASASREWPGTLRIDIVERAAVAAVVTGDRVLAVDAEAVVIGDRGIAPDVPRIEVATTATPGDEASEAAPGLAVVAELPADLRNWVEAVTVAHDGAGAGRVSVGLDLVGRAAVEMGPPELLADKVAAVRAVLDGTDLSCVEVIDVTVADLTTIRRDPACDAGGG